MARVEIAGPASIHILVVTTSSTSSSLTPIPSISTPTSTSTSTSSAARARWTFDSSQVPKGATIHLSFFSDTEEKELYTIQYKGGIGRKLRSRQWARLRIERQSVSSAGRPDEVDSFRAYRLLRPSLGSSTAHHETILIFAKPDTANFLSLIPDTTPLGEITLPGTHESCALYGFPISQCQQPSTPIEQQLLDGVRFLDVRLRVVGDELLMYHGPRPQRSSLTVLLSVLHTFLSAHPTETLILSLKEESPPFHPHFSSLVYAAFTPFLDKWFLEERIPRLGEVRGKGLLLTRFDRDQDGRGGWPVGMGIHPSTWPDSRREGFEWDCHGTTVRTQDWYRVKTFLSIPEKFEAIINHLTPTLSARPSGETQFTLSYTSASYFPLSLPTMIAKGFGWPEWGMGVEGINSRFCYWLLCCLADGERVRGCIASDFYRQSAADGGLAELLVQMNCAA